MTPHQIVKLDKAWEKFKEDHKPKGQALFYYSDNREYWKDGYLAHANESEAPLALANALILKLQHEFILPHYNNQPVCDALNLVKVYCDAIANIGAL